MSLPPARPKEKIFPVLVTQLPRHVAISPDAAFLIVDVIVTQNRHTPADGVIGVGQNYRRRATPGEDLLVRMV